MAGLAAEGQEFDLPAGEAVGPGLLQCGGAGGAVVSDLAAGEAAHRQGDAAQVERGGVGFAPAAEVFHAVGGEGEVARLALSFAGLE